MWFKLIEIVVQKKGMKFGLAVTSMLADYRLPLSLSLHLRGLQVFHSSGLESEAESHKDALCFVLHAAWFHTTPYRDLPATCDLG